MNEEISREALLIYLDNVRTLETIIHESERKKKEIDAHLEKLGLDACDEKKFVPPSKKEVDEWEKIRNGGAGCSKIILIFCIICLTIAAVATGLYIHFNSIAQANDRMDIKTPNENNAIYCIVTAIVFGIVGVISLVIRIATGKSDKNTQRKYNAIKQKYDDSMKEHEEKVAAEKARIKEIEKTLHEHEKLAPAEKMALDNEKASTAVLLQKAYSANIIPLQFRNIHGIYYLYDYLSTSNESLTSALMQYNLETIKQKLDEIIDLQGKHIIMQAQANKTLFEQNQRILEAAEATMNNTAVAAKYAQISALNSAVSVKLQTEQLAYQKAAFWLR